MDRIDRFHLNCRFFILQSYRQYLCYFFIILIIITGENAKYFHLFD